MYNYMYPLDTGFNMGFNMGYTYHSNSECRCRIIRNEQYEAEIKQLDQAYSKLMNEHISVCTQLRKYEIKNDRMQSEMQAMKQMFDKSADIELFKSMEHKLQESIRAQKYMNIRYKASTRYEYIQKLETQLHGLQQQNRHLKCQLNTIQSKQKQELIKLLCG